MSKPKTGCNSKEPVSNCQESSGVRRDPDERLTSAVRLAQALRVLGQALLDASQLIAGAREPSSASGACLIDAINDCLVSKAQAGVRDRYLKQLRSSLSIFARGREALRLEDVNTEAIEAWLRNPNWSQRTRLGYLIDVKTLFSWASKRALCSSNPADAIPRPKLDDARPGILSIEECRRLLDAAHRQGQGLPTFFALALFAGIRPLEIERMRPSMILEKQIEVTGEASKTRRRRLVEIQPACRAWLDAGQLELPPINLKRKLLRVRAAAQVNWSHDCLRHSFVSYALPIFGAHQTALWAGHSEAVLFRHYRELVTRSEAEQFWKILPAK